MNEPENIGGRIAANFRRANIAEGLAIQMFRPFSAIAEVEREEDHGIDLIATLLQRDGLSMVAEDSFLVQVKTHTAASFVFKGEGIKWLCQLQLPYFPVIANLNDATVALYTLNSSQWILHNCVVEKFVFRVEDEMDDIDDFSLGKPLMQWSISDCAHVDFPKWAYSVLKPAIKIEAMNQLYGRMSRFVELVGGTYYFKDRNANGLPNDPPRSGTITEITPWNHETIRDAVASVLGPFANSVANTPGLEDRSEDLLKLRESVRRLGVDPDPSNKWGEIAQEMAGWAKKRKEDKA